MIFIVVSVHTIVTINNSFFGNRAQKYCTSTPVNILVSFLLTFLFNPIFCSCCSFHPSLYQIWLKVAIFTGVCLSFQYRMDGTTYYLLPMPRKVLCTNHHLLFFVLFVLKGLDEAQIPWYIILCCFLARTCLVPQSVLVIFNIINMLSLLFTSNNIIYTNTREGSKLLFRPLCFIQLGKIATCNHPSFEFSFKHVYRDEILIFFIINDIIIEEQFLC